MERIEIRYNVEKMISLNPVVIFTTLVNREGEVARSILLSAGLPFLSFEMDLMEKGDMIRKHVEFISHGKTLPRVFINGHCIGDSTDLLKMYLCGDLYKELLENHVDKDFSNCRCDEPMHVMYGIPPYPQPKYIKEEDES